MFAYTTVPWLKVIQPTTSSNGKVPRQRSTLTHVTMQPSRRHTDDLIARAIAILLY